MVKKLSYLWALSGCLMANQAFAASALEGITFERLIAQVGKLHPMVLHFPVVLITLAPLVILLSRFSWGEMWLPTIPYFVHLATLSSLATAVLGFAAASNWAGGTLSDQLLWHRNLTVATSLVMTLLSLYLLIKRPIINKQNSLGMLMVTLVATLLLTLGAHLGAEAVHGRTFILFDVPENGDDYR